MCFVGLLVTCLKSCIPFRIAAMASRGFESPPPVMASQIEETEGRKSLRESALTWGVWRENWGFRVLSGEIAAKRRGIVGAGHMIGFTIWVSAIGGGSWGIFTAMVTNYDLSGGLTDLASSLEDKMTNRREENRKNTVCLFALWAKPWVQCTCLTLLSFCWRNIN